MLSPPFSVRATFGDGPLHLLVADDALLLHVHQQHSARTKTTFLNDVLGSNVVHPNLRGHHHNVVLGDVVSRKESKLRLL
jgi:hypothetical protein